jgi:hypothetical protein
MAEGHGWGGVSRAGSDHPAPACASAAPPYPRRGLLLVLMSPCFNLPALGYFSMQRRKRRLSLRKLRQAPHETRKTGRGSCSCYNSVPRERRVLLDLLELG